MRKNPVTLPVLLLLALPLITCVCAEGTVNNQDTYYLDNGIVRLGVDLTGGGSVFYFAESATGRNLLNHADKGRYVQQSYYGNPDGSVWSGQPWVWNPVQGGGCGEQPAKVIEQELGEERIWIKSMPVHWATGEDVTDAVMEETITLDDKTAHIRYRFEYTGETRHRAAHQELPAVFVDYDLPNLIVYRGEEPWTGGKLTQSVPGWPNQLSRSDENWAAYVDDEGWGIGVYFPGTTEMTVYRHPGESGPLGGGCSYFAPIRTFSVYSGMVFQYDVYLTIGQIEDMRQIFNTIRRGTENQ